MAHPPLYDKDKDEVNMHFERNHYSHMHRYSQRTTLTSLGYMDSQTTLQE